LPLATWVAPNGCPLRDFVSIYSEMNNIIREYEKLNHRNRKKDDKFREASMSTTILKEPDEKVVEELLISLYEDYYTT
jgi:ribosomal protein L35